MVAAGEVIRYFMKKEKCFIEMKNKIDSLTRHDNSSNDLHSDHENRIKEIETNLEQQLENLR